MKPQNNLFTIVSILAVILIFSTSGAEGEHSNMSRYNNFSLYSTNDTTGIREVRLDTISRNTKGKDSLKTDTVNSDTVTPKSMFSDLVKYSADDSVMFSLDGQKVFLYGNAKVTYLTTELTAAYITLDLENETTLAKGVKDTADQFIGNPVFKDGSQKFDCKELRYNYRSKKAIVKEIITEENGGFVQGKKTKKVDDDVYCIKDGIYTTCDHHDHPHFYLKMNRAKMVKGKKVFTGFSYLVLEDVPLPVGIPFGFFPITKKGSSGILMPSYGEEKMRGFNLKNGGYYFAVNDYFDVTFNGDIYSNGSWAGRFSSNYKKRYKYQGSLSLSRSINIRGEEGLPDYSKSKDFAVRWSHRQDPKANPYSTFSASVDISTSSNDYYNSRNINDFTNQRKQSSISYSKRWPDSPFSMSLAFNHSQNSRDTTISLSFPNFNFRMTQIYPFRKKNKSGRLAWYDQIGISYTADLKNSINTKEDKLFSSSLAKDWRNGFKHSIPLSASFKLVKDMTFTPSLSYTGVLYSNSVVKRWDGYNKTVIIDTIQGFKYAHNYSTSFSLSYSPKVYGMYVFKPESKVAAIRHVITPSISVNYTPELGVDRKKYWKTFSNTTTDEEIEYTMFMNPLFSVPSGAVESGSVNFSLDNNLEMKVRNDDDTTGENQFKKIKLIDRFRLATSYNMFLDSMNFSTIRMSGSTKLFKDKLNINFSGDLDPYALNAAGQRINKYAGGLGRLTRTNVTLSASFSSKKGEDAKKAKEDKVWNYNDYVDFDVPWNLSCNYSWSWYKTGDKTNTTQILRLNGDFKLTPKWKVGFSTGYDAERKEVTATSFNIYRDLHCWEMSFNAVPFGQHQSFNFEIRVKSSLLKDLKLMKRDSWYDR